MEGKNLVYRKRYLIKGTKGAYYVGDYVGEDPGGGATFWVRSGSFCVRANYYMEIPE